MNGWRGGGECVVMSYASYLVVSIFFFPFSYSRCRSPWVMLGGRPGTHEVAEKLWYSLPIWLEITLSIAARVG